jgi:hypothetical protein
MIGKIVDQSYYCQQSVHQGSGQVPGEDIHSEFSRIYKQNVTGKVKEKAAPGNAEPGNEKPDDEKPDNGNNAVSYFRQAAGVNGDVSSKPQKIFGGKLPEVKQGQPKLYDFIRLSRAAVKEIHEENEDPHEVFELANPLNKSDFLNELGIRKQGDTSQDGLSLAQKLDAISRKTAGKGFE